MTDLNYDIRIVDRLDAIIKQQQYTNRLLELILKELETLKEMEI